MNLFLFIFFKRMYAAKVDEAIERQKQQFAKEVNEELNKYKKLSQKKN